MNVFVSFRGIVRKVVAKKHCCKVNVQNVSHDASAIAYDNNCEIKQSQWGDVCFSNFNVTLSYKQL